MTLATEVQFELELRRFQLTRRQKTLCHKVSRILIDGPNSPIVRAGLKLLDGILESYRALRYDTVSTVLHHNEIANGINIGTAGELLSVGITRALSAAEYGLYIRNQTLFKDPGVSPDHGDNTHRIQFWILTSIRGPLDAFDVEELFQAVANNLGEGSPFTGLWDFLFDRQSGVSPKKQSDTDFRCPERLNLWLIRNQEHEYATLRRHLTARRETRTSQRQDRIGLMKMINSHNSELHDEVNALIEFTRSQYNTKLGILKRNEEILFPVLYALSYKQMQPGAVTSRLIEVCKSESASADFVRAFRASHPVAFSS